MKHLKQWSEVLSRLQRDFNNFTSNDIISKEIVYNFISVQVTDLMKSFADNTTNDLNLKDRRMIVRIEVSNVIAFAQMNAKHQYDEKHQFLFMKTSDHALVRSHSEYDILFNAMLDKKLNQQFVELFKILKRVDRLTYRLKLSNHWRIHLVLFVAQLKPVSENNFFNRSRSNHSKSIFVRDDTDKVKFYEIEEVVNKRLNDKRDTKYLIRWKEYDLEFDEWRNLSEMKNAMNLVREYKELMKQTNYLSSRLEITSISSVSTSSASKHQFFIKIILRKSFKSSVSLFLLKHLLLISWCKCDQESSYLSRQRLQCLLILSLFKHHRRNFSRSSLSWSSIRLLLDDHHDCYYLHLSYDYSNESVASLFWWEQNIMILLCYTSWCIMLCVCRLRKRFASGLALLVYSFRS